MARFITLTSEHGHEARINLDHVIFYVWNTATGGSSLIMTFGLSEAFKETPEQIDKIIASRPVR